MNSKKKVVMEDENMDFEPEFVDLDDRMEEFMEK
jgi:hypothetical protein